MCTTPYKYIGEMRGYGNFEGTIEQGVNEQEKGAVTSVVTLEGETSNSFG